MTYIDDYNRERVIDRYVDDIVGNLHFIETKEMLKDCLINKKRQLDNSDLEAEILMFNPLLLTDLYIEEILEEV